MVGKFIVLHCCNGGENGSFPVLDWWEKWCFFNARLVGKMVILQCWTGGKNSVFYSVGLVGKMVVLLWWTGGENYDFTVLDWWEK